MDENPKAKFGNLKPSLNTVPPVAVIHLGAVMGLGAKKYGAFNWRTSAVSASTYQAAALRHLMAWSDGEDADPESGASHLAHVMACCAITLDAMACGKLVDDRPGNGSAARVIAELTKPL